MIFVHPAFDRLVAFLDIKEKSFAEDALIIFAKCCQTRQHVGAHAFNSAHSCVCSKNCFKNLAHCQK